MKRWTLLGSLLLSLMFSLAVSVQDADCVCTTQPFVPNPPCYTICVAGLLLVASPRDLVEVFGIDSDVAGRLTRLQQEWRVNDVALAEANVLEQLQPDERQAVDDAFRNLAAEQLVAFISDSTRRLSAVLEPEKREEVLAILLPPVNDLPNRYVVVEGWGAMVDGQEWGSTSAIDVDADGLHIWVAERCGANSCEDSELAPILRFNPEGEVVAAFGSGMLNWPHGLHVDSQGNVWVTDARGGNGKGHQVHKFSPSGELLMSLGAAGEAGTDASHFNQPSDVITAESGDIFVADGHGGESNARIVKFDANGRFLMAWGEQGSAPGQFNTPHGLAFDSQGRLFVVDRGNNRIQIFDQLGNFLEEWYQFSRLSGIFIDANDTLYGADSESNERRGRGGWQRGIRIGSARTGEVTYFIPDTADANDGPLAGTSGAEGVAVDAAGNIYGAEVGPRGVAKYITP